jgi:hypothetical protein
MPRELDVLRPCHFQQQTGQYHIAPVGDADSPDLCHTDTSVSGVNCSQVAFILGPYLFPIGSYSRVVFVRGPHLFSTDIDSRLVTPAVALPGLAETAGGVKGCRSKLMDTCNSRKGDPLSGLCQGGTSFKENSLTFPELIIGR